MILHADDDLDMRYLYSRFLEARGFSVTSTADAPSAIDLLLQRVFSLIISDVTMPGNEDLLLARTAIQSTDTPVILLSSSYTPEVRELAAEIGIRACVEKSCNFGKLLEAISFALCPEGVLV